MKKIISYSTYFCRVMVFIEDIQGFKEIISSEKGPLLCIDYGLRNIGLAVSDADLLISSPYTIIRNSGNHADIVGNIGNKAMERSCRAVIIGWPKTLTNDLHPHAKNIYDLALLFYETWNLPILLWDESFSTSNALGQRKLIAEIHGRTNQAFTSWPLNKIGGKRRNPGKSTKMPDDHLAAQHILEEILRLLRRTD